jgi:AcrR family transcriptional regulator
MKPVKRTRQRTEGPRLTRDDWLDAAFVAVVEGGFDKLRVLMIAKALRVTRGSFYWHFADHAELLSALLERWRERQNLIDAELRPRAGADAQADLEHVLEAALAHVGADLEHMRFELALRGLGRREATVAQLLAEVDAMRLSLFEDKFQRLTGDPRSASELALLFYLAVVGCYQALARPGNPPQVKDYLKRLITQYLVVQQTPAKLARPAAAKKANKPGKPRKT